MPGFLISEIVRAVLGEEGVARAEQVSLRNGRCAGCEGPLACDETVTVVAGRQRWGFHVRYAHPDCLPSAVYEVEGDPPNPDAEQIGMRISGALVNHEGIELPVLVTELVANAYIADRPGGELTDLVLSWLLSQGFTLVGRLQQATRWAQGWTASVTPRSSTIAFAEITSEQDNPFCTGTVALPPGWMGTFERLGWCVLYHGTFKLPDVDAAHDRSLTQALSAAGQAGRLAGARITMHA